MADNASTEDYVYVYDVDESMETFNWEEILPVSLIYGLTLIAGIVGNCLIVFTIGKYRRMRTITNVFLVSLASADLLLVSICIPIKFAKLLSFTWTMGEFLCKFVHYIQNVSAICSVLTLTSMSLERYYAILHPIKAKYICTISQAQKVILGIWFLSFLLATPTIFIQILFPVGPNLDHFWCVIDWENRGWWRAYEVYLVFLLLILPTGIMGFAYASICKEVWQVMKQRAHMTNSTVRNGKNSVESYPMTTLDVDGNSTTGSLRPKRSAFSHRNQEENVTVKQVIKMLVAVVLLFIICWTPLMVNNLLTAFGVLHEENHGYLKMMRISFHLMAYINSCINPIVYGFMSRNFRDSFYNAICLCRGKSPSRQLSFTQTRTTSVSIARSYSVSNNERFATDQNNLDGRHLP